MANTTFGRSTYAAYASDSHANLIEQKWSQAMFKHGLATNPLKQFMGTSDDNIIQVNKELSKDKGDKITFHLRALLAGSGQGDDGTHEGYEEANTYYDDSVTIHERGHATKVNGIMTEQRTKIPLREQGKVSLGEWVGRALAADCIAALSGLNNTKSFAGQVTGGAALDKDSAKIETVNPASPSGRGSALTFGGRIFYGGQTAGSSSTFSTATGDTVLSGTAHLFGTYVIEFVKRVAKATIKYTDTTTGAVLCPLRPIMVDGKPHFVMLIHPQQAKALKADTRWLDAQKYANTRGSTNPIFTGMLGMWDNVIVHECDLIHTRYGMAGTTSAEYFYSSDQVITSSVYCARALFCGAQAGLLAYGQMPSWKEKMFDYGAKWGISTRMIYGVKKAVFNSIDFGVIAVDTAVSMTD